MKGSIIYLIAFTVADCVALLLTQASVLPAWWMISRLPILCALVGGLGGCIYCLRGVYLNACVKKQWDKEWLPWYYVRPIVSHLCGAISYLFLRAGLLLLEAKHVEGGTNLGFYALAFIAGLNVDKFIAKVEDIAQATWGIEKSRTSKEKEDKKDETSDI